MNLDVRCEHDLDRYEQLFDNPVLDTLFGVATGTGHFVQFCDQASLASFRTTCFASFLEVRDSLEAAHPVEVRHTLPPAEAAGGNGP